MSSFNDIKKDLGVFTHFLVFLGIASLMFGFFFTAMARPMCKLKNRMHNSDVSWDEIKKNIVTVNYGDSPEVVKQKIGEPDDQVTTTTKTIFSYQRYGLYEPVFFYEIEFRKDTLYQIISHD